MRGVWTKHIQQIWMAVMADQTNQYQEIAEELRAKRVPQRSKVTWGFVIFMAALTVLFFYLGNWQVQRLAQKQALITAVQTRAELPAVALPPVAEWVGLDPETYNFRQVILTGHFLKGNSVDVFTALADANGKFEGPGYWFMAPFVLDSGGTVIVNRGFVPQSSKVLFDDSSLPEGPLTLTGIARKSEPANAFTPGPDLAKRVEYVRSIARLQTLMDQELAPFASFYVNLDSAGAGVLPQGGETKMTFSNRHMEYILTWFSLGLITPLLTLFWLWRQRRS